MAVRKECFGPNVVCCFSGAAGHFDRNISSDQESDQGVLEDVVITTSYVGSQHEYHEDNT